jgi:hypothetical protein
MYVMGVSAKLHFFTCATSAIAPLLFNKIFADSNIIKTMTGSGSGFKVALTTLAINISHNQPVEVIFLRQQP